jgi:hypothetical protein
MVMLYLQKDISTLGIIGVTLIVIYFASGTNLWHTLITFFAGFASIALFIIIEPYRVRRFTVFLHPETDPLGIGLQMKQSLIAIGSGGIFGKGLGMSTQKFGFLPEAISDSIFAIIGEEIGIIGGTIVVLLFLTFLWQGIVNYIWSGSENLSGSQMSTIKTYDTSGTKTAMVTVISSNGQSASQVCGNTVSVKSNTIAKSKTTPTNTKSDNTNDGSSMLASIIALKNVPWITVAILVIFIMFFTIIYLIFNKTKI